MTQADAMPRDPLHYTMILANRYRETPGVYFACFFPRGEEEAHVCAKRKGVDIEDMLTQVAAGALMTIQELLRDRPMTMRAAALDLFRRKVFAFSTKLVDELVTQGLAQLQEGEEVDHGSKQEQEQGRQGEESSSEEPEADGGRDQ